MSQEAETGDIKMVDAPNMSQEAETTDIKMVEEPNMSLEAETTDIKQLDAPNMSPTRPQTFGMTTTLSSNHYHEPQYKKAAFTNLARMVKTTFLNKKSAFTNLARMVKTTFLNKKSAFFFKNDYELHRRTGRPNIVHAKECGV